MLRLAFLVASVAAVTISKGNPDVSRKAFEDGRVAAAKTVAAQ